MPGQLIASLCLRSQGLLLLEASQSIPQCVPAELTANRPYDLLWHPVVRLPTSLLSWGFVPFSVFVTMRPFYRDRSLRRSNSSCFIFPPLKFLTSLAAFSASCRSGFFHPVPLLGFALQRFSPPASCGTSRYPYLPSVASMTLASEVLLQPMIRCGCSRFRSRAHSILSWTFKRLFSPEPL